MQGNEGRLNLGSLETIQMVESARWSWRLRSEYDGGKQDADCLRSEYDGGKQDADRLRSEYDGGKGGV